MNKICEHGVDVEDLCRTCVIEQENELLEKIKNNLYKSVIDGIEAPDYIESSYWNDYVINNPEISKEKLRPLGDITGDLEPLILEMVEQHDLQVGEILNLIYGYMKVHTPGAFEVYEDDSNPVFYYGPEEE